MKVLELKGYKSLLALQAYHTLMLGLKMLPDYMGEQYEDFYERMKLMDDAGQRALITKAALFVRLQSDELEALICFCADANNVPYSKISINNLSPDKLIEVIVAVCVEVSKIKINIISEEQKKNSIISPSM